MNLKIYKNEKILSRNKTDQVRVWYIVLQVLQSAT